MPSINREWHPFTIASAEYEAEMSFYIKLLGDWTQALHNMFQHRMSGTIDTPLELYVRGPFGAPAQGVDKYSRVFLISGGIGATPFMSICKQLNHCHEQLGARINYRHRPQPNEPTLDDMAEQRIRDAVKNIYDVDVDVLELGVGGEGVVGGEVEKDRAEIAKHEMEYVANMLRVAANGTNVGVSSRENEGGSNEGKVNGSQHKDVSESVSNQDRVKVFNSDSGTCGNRMNNVRDSIDTARQLGGAMSTRRDTNNVAQAAGRSSVSSASSAGQPPVSTMDSVITVKLKTLRNMLQRPTDISDEEREARRREAKLGDVRSTLLSVLHSSRVMFVLAVLCVARAAVSISGSIFESGFVLLSTPVASGRWVSLAYALLSAPMSILTMLTVVLELSLHCSASFSSMRRVFEVLIFGPLSFVLTALEFRRWAMNDPGGPVLIFVQYVVLQSVTFVLIVGRLWRAVGRYGLLDSRQNHCAVHANSPNHIPDADFVWTVSKGGDDIWLRRELLSVVEGGAVGVHRYVTRGEVEESQDDADLEDGRRVSIAMREATKQGRPNWYRLLGDAARHTRSDGVIGIFFCGPEPMGKAVQSAAKKVEMWSNLRDAYLRSVSVGTLMQDIGLGERAEVLRLRDFGCRVRLVFHEENFS